MKTDFDESGSKALLDVVEEITGSGRVVRVDHDVEVLLRPALVKDATQQADVVDAAQRHLDAKKQRARPLQRPLFPFDDRSVSPHET